MEENNVNPYHHTITIEKLVYQGWGLGESNGFKIFVPRALPGEEVTVDVYKKKRRYGHARLLEIHKPSPLRKTPPCKHFPTCGGCQLMDVDYADQVQLKTDMLQDCVRQLYPDMQATIDPVCPSPRAHYYRNKMEFSVTKTDDGRVATGLKERGRFDSVVPTPSCMLQSETANALRAFLEEAFTQADCSVWDHHEHKGLLRYVVIRQSKTFDQFMVMFVISEKKIELFQGIAKELQAAFPEVVSVLVGINASPTDTAFVPNPICVAGDPFIEEVFQDNLRYKISPQSFFQTNTTQAKQLYQYILDLGELKATDTVFDLYCGTGTIGLFIARHVKEVIGIEENQQAIEDAKENAKRNHITNASFIVNRVKNTLKTTQIKPDVVILDPPRSGTVPKALRRIIALDAPKIIYVSCNPATLCRDLKEMCEAGYRIARFQPVDMFPNTYHLENVVVLVKG